MATKVQKGASWAYTIKRKSLLPKPIYLTFDDEAQGDAYVSNLEKLLDHGVVPEEFTQAKSPKVFLKHAIDGYIDKVHVPDTDAKLLAGLRREIGDKRLDAIDYQWTESWVNSMKVSLAPSTVRHYVGALARCLDWTIRLGTTSLMANPLRMLPKRYATSADKQDVSRDRRLSDSEERAIRAILKGAKPEGRQRPLELKHKESLLLLFDLALETAMRMREMFTLTAGQVDLTNKTIFLDKTKNGQKRQVPMSSLALAMMRVRLAGANQDDLIFPWWDGRTESLNNVTSGLSQQFARVFDAAGCGDVRFHDTRHEATSRLFERTEMSDLEISTITGHSDPRMLKRYANLKASDLSKKMW